VKEQITAQSEFQSKRETDPMGNAAQGAMKVSAGKKINCRSDAIFV
jgi:hypothetical protein